VNKVSIEFGIFHFVGIGGIGMSGIAEILHDQGYKVQGSDVSASPNVERLRELGIKVYIGHDTANVEDAAVVVVSSAIKSENPEVAAARQRFVPVVRRAEMLGEIMRLKRSIAIGGTHGKTTTTTLVAAMLDAGDLDPTVINGGIINKYGTNARLGHGEWLVAEADESDGTFTKLPATVSVVTNIDPEHMEHYGSEKALHEAFETFVGNIPFYGFAVLCTDHPEVQSLFSKITDRRLITYGFNPQANIRAIDVRTLPDHSRFSVTISARGKSPARTITDLVLPMVGRHNVQNSLVGVAIGLELGLTDEQISKGLSTFSGVKRRFTKTGDVKGVTIIDDYGHHPVEINAVLSAARNAAGSNNVVAVMQPHRYSRLQDLFEDFCTCFNDADHVFIADVYAAGETPLEGASKEALVEGIHSRGHQSVFALSSPDDLARSVAPLVSPGDFVICLGAGNITQWAYALPQQLKDLDQSRGAA